MFLILNFSELENKMAELKTTAEDFQKLYANGTQLAPEKQKRVECDLI